MITRDLTSELKLCLSESPAVALTGPRQSGKTTLARMLCPDHNYYTFEDPLIRERFRDDPLGFLNKCRKAAIFDEAQHVPDLFSYLQGMIDEDPKPGRFIITGSQQFGLSERITQSLSGRIAMLDLLPFSVSELLAGKTLPASLDETLWKGAYPPVHDRSLRAARWNTDYVSTYLQRDVRQITQVHNLDLFTRFLRLCAGSVGQLFNASRIGADCGIDQKTAQHWLSILQASYVATPLPPYYENFRKRTIKTPKLYFYDTGVVCSLLGIQTASQLENHPLRGAIFENWVFCELTKLLCNRGLPPRLYFWRTHGGQEVDFILESEGKVFGIEVKAGMTIRSSMLRPLIKALSQWPSGTTRAMAIYGGEEKYTHQDIHCLPWRQISQII